MTNVSRRRLLLTGASAVPALALGGLLSACAPPPLPDEATTRNVADFGAVGDGITDDTAAFQAAFADLGAAGGSVFVPPGVHSVVDVRPPAGCTLFGAGNRSVLRLPDGANRNLCTVTTSDVTVTRVRLDGNRAGQTKVCNAIAFWAPATRGRVVACEVVGASGYNVVAFPGVTDIVVARNLSADADEELIESQGASRMVIVGNHCLNAGKNAIYVWGNTAMGGSAADITIVGNVVSGWSQDAPGCAAIRVEDGSGDITVSGNVVTAGDSGVGATGINISSSTGAPLAGVTVTGNVVEDSLGFGLAAQNVAAAVLHGNVVHQAGALGVRVDRNATATVVSANVVSGSGSSGIGLLSAHDFAVRANLCLSNGNDASRPAYDRNGIDLWGGNGANPPIQRGTIVANRCSDAAAGTQLHGVALVNRVQQVTLAANVVDGNTDAGAARYFAVLDDATTTAVSRQVEATVDSTETAVAHGLGYVPSTVHVTLTGPDRVWVTEAADDINVYLCAEADGATCDLLVG